MAGREERLNQTVNRTIKFYVDVFISEVNCEHLPEWSPRISYSFFYFVSSDGCQSPSFLANEHLVLLSQTNRIHASMAASTHHVTDGGIMYDKK